MDELAPKKESDPRLQRSRALIVAAVTELVEDKPVEQLSITRVVEAAGVTRPTFYQHFPDVVSAVQEAAYVRLAAAFPEPGEMSGSRPTDAELHRHIVAHASAVLSHLAGHRSFYQHVLAAAAGVEFFNRFVALVASRMLPGSLETGGQSDEFQRDATTVMASGMMWFVVRWVSDAAPEPPSAATMAMRAADVAIALRPQLPPG